MAFEAAYICADSKVVRVCFDERLSSLGDLLDGKPSVGLVVKGAAASASGDGLVNYPFLRKKITSQPIFAIRPFATVHTQKELIATTVEHPRLRTTRTVLKVIGTGPI